MAKVTVTYYPEANYEEGKRVGETTRKEMFDNTQYWESVEGGFFRIITDTGEHFLTDVFRVDVQDQENK